MTEGIILEIAKHMVAYIAAPVAGLYAWLGRKLYTRVEKLEETHADLKSKQELGNYRLDELKHDISRLESKVDKLLEKI